MSSCQFTPPINPIMLCTSSLLTSLILYSAVLFFPRLFLCHLFIISSVSPLRPCSSLLQHFLHPPSSSFMSVTNSYLLLSLPFIPLGLHIVINQNSKSPSFCFQFIFFLFSLLLCFFLTFPVNVYCVSVRNIKSKRRKCAFVWDYFPTYLVQGVS